MNAQHKKAAVTLGISCIVSVLIIVLTLFDILTPLENKSYDSRVASLAHTSTPSEDIILILLDQASLDWGFAEKGWSYPFPRSTWGDILRFMDIADAKAVIFDILYTEPSKDGIQDDKIFASASAQFARTIQSVYFSTQSAADEYWPPSIPQPVLRIENFSAPDTKQVFAQFPIQYLASSAHMLGTVSQTANSDGVTRQGTLFYMFEGKAVPSLSIAALLTGEKIETPLVYNEKNHTAQLGSYTIPSDAFANVLLRFRGDLDRYVPYNVAQILSSYDSILTGTEPLLEPELFTGKYVFIGYYAPGLFDICATPISTNYPGVGIHITLLDNILQNDFIVKPSILITYLYIILCACAGSCFAFYIKKMRYTLIIMTASVLCILAAGFIGYIAGYWIPMIAPLFSISTSFFITFLVNYNTEGRQKRYIKTAFRHYLSPVVIEQLIAHPEHLKLGGERREISIFFSDIQGFTTISEKLSPEDLTHILNEYLSAMSDIILNSGGTIDKYEGDAIIAFWNAPASQENHSQSALQAALDCQKRLAEMRPYFFEKTGTDLRMRIGLNTGNAVVGNLGSRQRFNYTMIGDSVNLAARLEGLNKQFGTYTMCTKTMRCKSTSDIYFRELAHVAVVGKKEVVTVFEPMTIHEYHEKESILRIFDAARTFFYDGNFQEALGSFQSISDVDKPAFFYAEKCRTFLVNPDENWIGVWQATSK